MFRDVIKDGLFEEGFFEVEVFDYGNSVIVNGFKVYFINREFLIIF